MIYPSKEATSGTTPLNRPLSNSSLPGKLSSLKGLSCSNSLLSDRDATELAKLPQLEVLHIFNTKITDKGLRALAQVSTLKELRIDGTAVSAAGLQALASGLAGC